MEAAAWFAVLSLILLVLLALSVRRGQRLEQERNAFAEKLAKFDHDGDGKPGGSRKRTK